VQRVGTQLPRHTLAVLLLWSAAILAWGIARGPLRDRDAAPATPAATPAPTPPSERVGRADDLAALGPGFVVWESARSGTWRIWRRDLQSAEERPITPAEPARRHCCAHLSPDGSRLAYLAVAEGRYGEREFGELRLIDLANAATPARVVARRAQTYGSGHRAAIWHGPRLLQYIDDSGAAIAVDLDKSATGATDRLAGPPPAGAGWLFDPTRRHATSGVPTFSVYDPAQREVLPRNVLGGCEPYFSHDGRWGVWVAGAGGPVYRMDLATRSTSRILSKNDERVAGGQQGYVYFPMLSSDSEALAFGASADEHDHVQGNYDVFIAPTDPRTLDIAGPVVRVTADPGSDRYPDIHLAPSGAARRAVGRAGYRSSVAAQPVRPARRSTWPSDREGLVFLLERGDAANLVGPPGRERTIGLAPRGRARFDHAFGLFLGGGAFAAAPDDAHEIVEGLKRSNEVTVELTLRPSRLDQRGALLALAGPRQTNLLIEQRGRALAVHLLTARETRSLEVAALPTESGAAHHLAVAYAPGALTAWLDGRQTASSAEFQRDFFQWRPGTFTLGQDAGGGSPWSGVLATIALYDRALAAEEVAENARLAAVARGPEPPPRLRVQARLRARSRLPTLEEIAPYRQAMAVFEYEVERVIGEDPGGAGAVRPGARLRVAHWTILDGAATPEAGLAEAASVELVLERFASQPQLETVVVSDTLGRGQLERYLDVRP
jgi:hypothetical protein